MIKSFIISNYMATCEIADLTKVELYFLSAKLFTFYICTPPGRVSCKCLHDLSITWMCARVRYWNLIGLKGKLLVLSFLRLVAVKSSTHLIVNLDSGGFDFGLGRI
ncbi:hypothetical protein CEXT_345941 [Caerostris extrusa]|uniref:Uncharacterized protein n=1 Tax=Caerostris extrusa TaxID=172846 RepID=A0AAV4M941_CAEEX|nr:hypothetical protein CEXT_345941 [Caerostris extrusa]